MRGQLLVLFIVLAACALMFRGSRPVGDAIVLGESVTALQARLGPGVTFAAEGRTWIHYGAAAALVENGRVVGLTGVDVNASGRVIPRGDTRAHVRHVLGEPTTWTEDRDQFQLRDCRVSVIYSGQERVNYAAKDRVKQVVISLL